MNKIRKLLIPALFFCLTISGAAVFESHAEETQGEQASAGSALQDENPQRLEEVTGMDENGNIYEVDDSEGTVQQPKMRLFSRTSSVQVVNFRTKEMQPPVTKNTTPASPDIPTAHMVRMRHTWEPMTGKSDLCFPVL